jgi:hypothetical protein
VKRSAVAWIPQQWPGAEHVLIVDQGGQQWTARGVALAALPAGVVRVDYDLRVWPAGCLLTATISSEKLRRSVELISDADHRWADSAGNALPKLDGCTDVDLAISPLTNTLPLRRLPADPGRATGLDVAYISVPSLRVSRSTQTYRCLERRSAGADWLYSAGRFRAELQVDDDGIVELYSDLWRRVRPENR